MNARMRALLAAVALALATLAGCGDEGPPAVSVPSLAQDLDRVDEAIVDRDFDRAAAAVDDIEAATEAALADGTLSRSDADRILAAVTALRDALLERPEEQPTAPESSPTEEPPPPSDQDGDEEEGDDEEDESDKDEKKDKDKEKENEGEGDGDGEGEGDD